MKIPHRHSIVSEVADSLRDAIHNREFLDHLPGVRKLSASLHVSIPTILAAIRVLETEGLLQSHPGKRTRILPGRKRAGARRKKVPQVVFLTFTSNWISGSEYYQAVLHDLREMGIGIRIFECVYASQKIVQKELEELTTVEDPDCWVLLGPPADVQSLFARKQKPCIIDGVTIPGLPLPDFEVDFSALYRHAVNHLQRSGHRNICLLTTRHSAGINPESINVFRAAVQKLLPDGQHWESVRTYDGTAEEFTRLLEGLFSAHKPPPTALVIAKVNRVAGAMTWLMNQGLKVPGDISIISRDHDDILECLCPLPAHYRQPPSVANRFVRAILAILEKRHIRSHYRVMTEFVEGGTVGAAHGSAGKGVAADGSSRLGGTRTRTDFRPEDFKSSVSAIPPRAGGGSVAESATKCHGKDRRPGGLTQAMTT